MYPKGREKQAHEVKTFLTE